MPSSQPIKSAAAWELVTASIILFLVLCYRILPVLSARFIPDRINNSVHSMASFVPSQLSSFIRAVMGENNSAHTLLYFVLFALVLSATIMGFFYDE